MIGEWEQVDESVQEGMRVQESEYVEPVQEQTDESGLEPSYAELKTILTSLDIPFKGNASKEELMKLYEGSM